MPKAKKKTFPKLKKSLKKFLTDESGKITKKDALGISAGAALFAGVDEAVAAHINGTGSASASWDPGASASVSASASCNHVNGVVNGHYNTTPSGSASISGHGSHGSHGNHGSGGWC